MTNIREFRGIFYTMESGKVTGITRVFTFTDRNQLKKFIDEHKHSYKLKEAYSISRDYQMNKIL